MEEGREQSREVSGSFSHHSCFPRIITSWGPVPALTIRARFPQANQNPHLLGSRWSCFNPLFPGQVVAKFPSACSRLWAAPTCTTQDPDTQWGFEKAGITGVWQRLLSSILGAHAYLCTGTPGAPASLDSGISMVGISPNSPSHNKPVVKPSLLLSL